MSGITRNWQNGLASKLGYERYYPFNKDFKIWFDFGKISPQFRALGPTEVHFSEMRI